MLIGRIATDKLTPAMAAGLTKSPMEMIDLVSMIDASEIKMLSEKRQALLEMRP